MVQLLMQKEAINKFKLSEDISEKNYIGPAATGPLMNALLVEMDGFPSNQRVIVIGATNRA